MDLTALEFAFIIVAGILTGVINTLAGSGSLITLPIFIFMCGLPAPVANGTNRIGVLMQAFTGTAGFYKHDKSLFNGTQWLVVPSVVGAIIGSYLATKMDKELMYNTIGFLMVFMLFFLFLKPKRWIRESQATAAGNKSLLNIIVFFFIGLYGGFIQAGVGIFLLAALVLSARYSLKKGNGVKLLIVAIFNIPTLIIFFMYDQVHIGYGLLLGVCQMIGSILGVRFAEKVPNANVWIHRLLIVIVAVSAIKFLGIYDWLVG